MSLWTSHGSPPKFPASIFYILPLRNKFHAKQQHTMLEIDISLSACPIWIDYKQYLPWSHPNVAGISLRGPFLPYQKNKCFVFLLGATMVRHVSPKFATTFQLTFYLGQKKHCCFSKIINIYPLHNNQPLFFHKLLGNNLRVINDFCRWVRHHSQTTRQLGAFLGGWKIGWEIAMVGIKDTR